MKLRNLIILLIIGAVVYFLFFSPDDNTNTSDNNNNTNNTTQNDTDTSGGKGKGCTIDKNEFEKADIFTRLDPNSPKNSLPVAVSLRQFAPTPRNQGEQSSCVGWSTCYSARTILEAVAKGVQPNSTPFSPAYIYNQIHEGGCMNGSFINDALDKMKAEGVLPLSQFPYSENACNRRPTSSERQQAGNYRIKGYNRLTNGQSFDIDITAMKQNLAKGAPVLIAMPVGGSFYNGVGSDGLWNPTGRDYDKLEMFRSGDYDRSGLGGHAMCVIGYDNDKFGGAVEIQNSWGPDFGDRGFFWMKYKDFESFCMEAYGLFPLPSVKADPNVSFKVSMGFPINKTSNYITFRQKQGNTFETNQTVAKNTRFKVEMTNSTPCYAYMLGQETDGSSYVLFPYTPKHSPFIGIAGTRIFPEKESLMPDEIGTKDVFAVILSKNALNIEQIKNAVSRSSASTYAEKIRQVLGSDLIDASSVKFTTDQMINITAGKTTKNTVAIIMEINKR
jgi:C1A family cysteine protease